jgi:DNA-binding transcriptional ArsR family regulator
MMNKPLENSERLLDLCKAIGHETRFAIIKLLIQRTQFCGDLVTELGVAQSTVSHHLKILRQAGIVIAEDQGNWVCYRLDPNTIQEMRDLLEKFVDGNLI